MQELQNKKQVRKLALLLGSVYMISYITRINFGAIISEMEYATGISRSLLSMSITGSFITYGIGQIVSGILGDRFSPKKLMSLGLAMTILMNLAEGAGKTEGFDWGSVLLRMVNSCCGTRQIPCRRCVCVICRPQPLAPFP